MNMKIHNQIILGLSFLLLLGEWGCAHHAIAPSPLPDSIQQQLGKIVVMARSTEEQKTFGTPGTGRLSNIGRGVGSRCGDNSTWLPGISDLWWIESNSVCIGSDPPLTA